MALALILWLGSGKLLNHEALDASFRESLCGDCYLADPHFPGSLSAARSRGRSMA